MMFAVYASHAEIDDPLSALRVGEQPEPDAQQGWVRVKVSHASLNRHDLFTLRGITSHHGHASRHEEQDRLHALHGKDLPYLGHDALP